MKRMNQPSPSVERMSSDATISTRATPTAWRAPATIWGIASPITARRSTRVSVPPKLLTTSGSSACLAVRTPKMVLIATKMNEAQAITMMRDRSPIPTTSTSTGRKRMTGMGRRNSSSEVATDPGLFHHSTTTPNTTPTITPMTQPATARYTLFPIWNSRLSPDR